ncbi:unnamed protein product [marine sediment metagenome]|uniref:Uncharacterized protein n=1 Tax=marine sediment metagenome TaxID=412755 RepID=X0YJL7_9ZZZZ
MVIPKFREIEVEEKEKESKQKRYDPIKKIIDLLENELEGDETKLPPGKHNIFVAKINGEWQGYAESDGEIKAEAVRVSFKRHYFGDQKAEKPKFHPEGWCVTICILRIWIFCVGEFKFCF